METYTIAADVVWSQFGAKAPLGDPTLALFQSIHHHGKLASYEDTSYPTS